MNVQARNRASRGGVIKGLVQVLAGLVVLGAAIALTVVLIQARPEPQTETPQRKGPMLNVVRVVRQTVPVEVRGFGTVQPVRQIQLVPQVGGRVIQIDPGLVNGGYFEPDQVLLTIDPSDYQLAVQQAEAQLEAAKASVRTAEASIENARTRFTLEQAEAEVRRAEWQANHPDTKPDPLVVREPQIREAKAAIRSAEASKLSAEAQVSRAQAALAEAKLNLQRTRISVPFAGRVLNESVDLGQFIVAGQPIATVYGTDKAEVSVPLELSDLAWLEVPKGRGAHNPHAPDEPAQTTGSNAYVDVELEDDTRTWSARVVRTEGQIDPQSRMAHVVVQVDQPEAVGPDTMPLTPGMFATVRLDGRPIHDVVVIPRYALRQGQSVWVASDGKLIIQPVDIVHADRDYVYVRSGVEDGQMIVVSMLDTVTDGMTIRTNIVDRAVAGVSTTGPRTDAERSLRPEPRQP